MSLIFTHVVLFPATFTIKVLIVVSLLSSIIPMTEFKINAVHRLLSFGDSL